MGAGFLYAPRLVVASHRQPQAIHGEHPAVLVTEQVIFRCAAADWHILPKNGYHLRAERDGLDFAVRFALAHIHDDREDIRMRHIAPFILNSGDEETGISVKNRLFADTSQSGPDRISIVLFINFEIKLCFGTVFEIDEIPIIKEIDVFDF